ncbi:protein kinase [Stieleria sp. TO1_6]|uniref:serine/threonine-protein kinase n=1 Tax=Stieleria tagensis TaxID=2956795 RepID=UPI00209A9B72|nr:serine/threonine-protein kinase [Stieleria tagensis]MCO8122377.1 protein kinase [Stieleria tagensis]
MKPPEFLGPYRIGQTIGRGGMGTVFKATHEKTGQQVAVKLIATQMSDEMRFRRRFHAEIETLKMLKHPNIVRLIGYGEEQGMLFYSMEYVAGDTLQEIIRREKKLSWEAVLDISIQVCAALKHAHDFGVIHRDLKPANLIIQDDGTVKLVDFGISKIFGHDQTAVGSIMGTADFMSPEQASESGITPRTDLFSLGCVMYAMLCGRPPFRGKNVTEVIAAVKHKEFIPLDMIDPHLPDDVVQIVAELLEKLPENRPPTALAVMNRLKAMRTGLQRMQTMVDRDAQPEPEPSGSGSSGGGSSGGALDPLDSQADKLTGSGLLGSDTAAAAPAAGTGGAVGQPDGGVDPSDKTRLGSELTRRNDTVENVNASNGTPTAKGQVDPAAATVHTEGRSGDRGTVLGTGVTALADGVPSALPMETDSGTEPSISESGQTHFQTVSDGELRDGYFATALDRQERPLLQTLSIAALAIALLVGVGFLIVSLRGPTAADLLAEIELQDASGQSFEADNAVERFLKLYPEHPQADSLRERQMTQRVQAAVRRLKLKSKLRTSEGPLFEQSFLDAMALQSTDPDAAQQRLQHWLDVFHDSTLQDADESDERSELAELAQFEVDRLAALSGQSDASVQDPKLQELMLRIDRAQQLPDDQRRKMLQGIVNLYDGQNWAAEARERAQRLLDANRE